jgi:N-methylhydantoinase A
MSAFGFLAAAPTVDDVRGYPAPITAVDWDKVACLYAEMEAQARQLLRSAGAPHDLVITRSADIRYVGQGYEITVELPSAQFDQSQEDAIGKAFIDTYESVFGRTIANGTPEMINWRLSASVPTTAMDLAYRPNPSPPRPPRTVHFAEHGPLTVDVYNRYLLQPGTTIAGPALFEERETSCSVGPDCTVTIDRQHNLIIDIHSSDYASDQHEHHVPNQLPSSAEVLKET